MYRVPAAVSADSDTRSSCSFTKLGPSASASEGGGQGKEAVASVMRSLAAAVGGGASA
jgi:hypothetical protein